MFAKCPISVLLTCCPMPPRSGLTIFSRRFRSDSSSSMYALYYSSLIGVCANGLVCLCLSQQQLPRREFSIPMWVIVSSSAFIKDFWNCVTVKRSWSHTNCWLFDDIHRFPKHSCSPGHVPRKSSFWIGSDSVWFAIVFDLNMISPVTLSNPRSVFMTLWMSRRQRDFQHPP